MNETTGQKIIVATLDGKSYYKIVKTLKLLDLDYKEVSPQEAINSCSKIIITSKKESIIFKHKNVMLDSELNDHPVIIKAKILRKLTVNPHLYDQLIIGIDPGVRIGISIFYLHGEIESMVLMSIESALNFLIKILTEIKAQKKIVRIGDGNRIIANDIAFFIKSKLLDLVHVEIVNEYGTSAQKRNGNRRIIKDKSSARLIAFRTGKIFEPRIHLN